ncbi:MAG: hypothetical protein ABSG15_14115 [FCB group bacterium]|jgi:hypothetical protein
MRKLLIYIFVCAFIFISAFSQNPFEIAKIKIDLGKFSSQYKSYTTEFYTASKKKIGKYLCFDLIDIIDKNIKQLSVTERKKLVIIPETSTGESIATTYNDYDINNRKITPMLIVGVIKGTVGDTAVIEDFGGANSKLKIKSVDNEIQKAVERRVYLQMKNISDEDRDKIFINRSLIFPEDQNTSRWMTDLVDLKLYLLK